MLDLLDYWRDHPPVHEMVAGFLGVKPATRFVSPPSSANDPSGIGGLMAQFPAGLVPAER